MAQAQASVNLGVKTIDLINEKMKNKELFFSFEYYPPKTDKGVESLKKRLHTMNTWGPQWMDVTWGAGGTTSDLTPKICDYIQNDVKGNCMMHLTCTNMPKEKIDIALEKAKEMGLKNILALRGDPPEGQTEWKAIDSGFTCALDLIKYIKEKYNDYFGITVSGYPEGHPLVRKKIKESCPDWDEVNNKPFYWAPRKDKDGDWEGVSANDWKNELNYLKQKVDAGGQVIITQLFYDSKLFIEFVKEIRKIGIKAPVLPGIMPISNYNSFQRMTGFCRTVIPDKLSSKLTELKDDSKAFMLFGLDYIKEMLSDIAKADIVPGYHIYTMNLEYLSVSLLKQNDMFVKDSGNVENIENSYKIAHAKQVDKWTQAANKTAAAKAAPKNEAQTQSQTQDKTQSQSQTDQNQNQKKFSEVNTF